MVRISILTDREREVIRKKLENRGLSQLDSNVLTRSVRPKLISIGSIDAKHLLQRLKYNQKAASIEDRIKRLVLKNVKSVKAIILYGSAIQTNYANYNDIDVVIVTKKRYWNNWSEKIDIIEKIKKNYLEINLDVQLIDKETLIKEYPYNPSLIYQLSDSKIIYGHISLPKKVEIHKYDLLMKLDWSEVIDKDEESKEIYRAIRNTILVRLLINRIINNSLLKQEVESYLGKILARRLREGRASKLEKNLAKYYLNELNKETTNKIKESKWENLILSTR